MSLANVLNCDAHRILVHLKLIETIEDDLHQFVGSEK